MEPGGIEAFIRREVLPHAPDAWIDEAKTQIGYEISFTRYFYKPQPLRPLDAIRADILALETRDQRADGRDHRGQRKMMDGLKHYPVMKYSGVPWLGELPEHWDVKRLGFLCSKIGSGKTPQGGRGVYVNAGVLFIRSQNVYDDGLILKDVAFITDETDNEMSSSRVNPGDILFNITGASLGRTCLVPDNFPLANVDQHVCIIRLSDRKLRQFVAIALKANCTKAQIAVAQTGAAREGLNFRHVSKLAFAKPPIDEQSSIVRFLDHADRRIRRYVRAKRKLIRLLQEQKQAIIRQTVTRGLDPDVPLKPSGLVWLGDIPAHWDVKPAKFFYRETDERSAFGG